MLPVPDGDANELVHTIDTGAGDAGTSADVLDGNYKVRYSLVLWLRLTFTIEVPS